MNPDTTHPATPARGQPAAPEPVADVADGLLFRMAETLAGISSRTSGLWYRISLVDLPGGFMEPKSPDIEIKAPSADEARQIAEALPWAGPVHHFVEPGAQHDSGFDHWIWQGILDDFRVRVVGLEQIGGAA
jgi:hypothetical protein